jgi:hypothetical protein
MIATLAFWSAACAGTSTGNPFEPMKTGGEETGTLDGGGFCDSKKSELGSLDAQSPLGFSAAQMLALANTTPEVEIEWPPASSMITVTPESGRSKLQIEVTARTDKPRWNDRSRRVSSGGPEPTIATVGIAGPECPDQLELDVTVRLKTEGGALDESFDATLIAFTSRAARIYQQIAADKLRGMLDAVFRGDPNWELRSVQITMGFSELGSTGDLGFGFAQRQEPAAGVPTAATASPAVVHWPAGSPCRYGQFETTLDRKIGDWSAREGIELINRPGLQLQAATGSKTGLSAQFTPSRDKLCFDATSFAPTLELPGQVRIQTADQQIDGTWNASLTLTASAEGALEQAELSYDKMGGIVGLLVPASAFETTFGMRGIALGNAHQAAAFIDLTRPTGGAAASGRIAVWVAGAPPMCATTPQAPPAGSGMAVGTPGCRGIDLGPLLEMTISE